MVHNLKDRIQNTVGMSNEMWEDISSKVFPLSVKKGKVLVEQGTCNKVVYFIVKGGFVSSFISEKGNKKASWFFLSNDFDFVSCSDSFFTNLPTSYELKAIEDSEVITLNKKDIDNWVEHYPLFNRFYREVIISRFLSIQNVRSVLLTNTVEDLVLYLKKNHPLFFLRVQDYYLAQFIGVSPEWYSKLKKKLLLSSKL